MVRNRQQLNGWIYNINNRWLNATYFNSEVLSWQNTLKPIIQKILLKKELKKWRLKS